MVHAVPRRTRLPRGSAISWASPEYCRPQDPSRASACARRLSDVATLSRSIAGQRRIAAVVPIAAVRRPVRGRRGDERVAGVCRCAAERLRAHACSKRDQRRREQ